MSTERERIIRAAVAAMPHPHTTTADDILCGFSVHMDEYDIIAIWNAARSQASATAAKDLQAVRELAELKRMLHDGQPMPTSDAVYSRMSEINPGWFEPRNSPIDVVDLALYAVRQLLAEKGFK